MNKNPGIIGRKVGMTQIFNEAGELIPCTVIESGCIVVGKRSQEKDGYSALVLGLGKRKDKHTSKAVKGSFAKAGVDTPKHVKELRLSEEAAAGYEIGQVVKVEDVFEVGQRIDVQSRSKGHGFTGVMVRHNFKGAKSSHGAHEVYRHGGSIGMATTPGRVWRGTKMAGQHGNKIVSVLNQKVAKVVGDKQLLLIEGTVPGAPNSIVRVQGAVKKRIKNL